MREESNRVINGMQRRASAEAEQRQQFLQQMKENAAYTERAEERNFEIQKRNLQQNLLASQLEADQQQKQYQIDRKTAEEFFGGLATFSSALGDLQKRKKAKEEKEKVFTEVIEGAIDPVILAEKSVIHRQLGSQLNLQGYQFNAILQEQLANGADPNAASKAFASNPASTFQTNEANITALMTEMLPNAFEQVLQDDTKRFEINGRSLTAKEMAADPETLRALYDVVRLKFLEDKNLVGLELGVLANGLQKSEQYIATKVNAARVKQTNNNYDMMEQAQFANIRNAPELFLQNANNYFQNWAVNPKLGFTGALDNFEKIAVMEGKDGFILPLDALDQVDLKGTGKRFSEEFPIRWARMQEARTNQELKRQRREFALEDNAYEADQRRILRGLTEDPSMANADAAVEFFRETYGKVPAEITRFQSSYTTEAIKKIESAKQFLAIPNGFITLEAVEAAEAVDADTGKEMRRRLVNQESRYNSGIFKETSEAFKSTANGVTAYGTNKPNTPASVFLQTMMRSEYRKRVDQAVAGGMDFGQAATTIGQQLDAEVKAGARNPDSKWFRKADTPGGAAAFPNLNKGMLSSVERSNQRYNTLKQNIKTNGLEKTINTKDSILTLDEAQQVLSNYGKSSFVVPQSVLAVSGMSNGLDPMVIINRQLQAQGMQPLPPPPSLASTSELVSPAFQKLLYKTPSVNRSARGLGTSNTFNPSIVPNNLGETVQLDSQVTGLNPSYLSAIGEVQGEYSPEVVAKYSDMFARSGSPVAAAISFFADQGYTGSALLQKQKEFAIAMYKYGGGLEALKGMRRNGFTNKMVQLVHGNEAMKTYRGGADGNAVFYDEVLHSGANEHVHAQLKTKEDVAALKQLAANTIDPFSGQPYRITSELRPGDPGAHGSGLALDIAPPVNLPVEHEAAWYHEFFRQMGMNPFQIK